MGIMGSPRNGAILMCEFDAHELELVGDGNMVKRRSVIVMSPQHQRRERVLHVVPISMTAPHKIKPWHVEVPLHCIPAPARRKEGVRWAKCDMVVTVGWSRLNRFRGSRKGGYATYHDAQVDLATMVRLKKGIAAVFGIRQDLWLSGHVAAETPDVASSEDEWRVRELNLGKMSRMRSENSD